MRLHHEVFRCTGHAILVRSVVNDGRFSAEIVMRRRRRGDPLQSCGFPRIVGGSLALGHAPEKIEQEDELAAAGYERGNCYESFQWYHFRNGGHFRGWRIAPQP